MQLCKIVEHPLVAKRQNVFLSANSLCYYRGIVTQRPTDRCRITFRRFALPIREELGELCFVLEMMKIFDVHLRSRPGRAAIGARGAPHVRSALFLAFGRSGPAFD